MPGKLVLIHTVPPLIEVFNHLGINLLPEVRFFHILDEPLLEQVRLQGGIRAEQVARLQDHIDTAQGISASAVLVTCSTLSPGLDRVHAEIPLFKIDQAMIEKAVQSGPRIGVIATNQTTLEPTNRSLSDEAKRAGKVVDIVLVFVEGALPALLNGDGVKHDELVGKAVQQLAGDVEIILLAQASMARVIATIPTGSCQVPILTSPQTALERVKEVFTQRRRS